MKKNIKRILIIILIISVSATSVFTVSASGVSTQSSSYINYYASQITTDSGGRILVDGIITGTRIMDTIGVKTLVIQKYQSGSWVNMKTWNYLYNYSSASSVFTCTYYGSIGAQYRAIITYYASLNGGSDSRIMTTRSVTAVN